MSTLEFAPTGFFQMRNYAIARDGVPVGEIQCGRMRTSAAITMNGKSYTGAREGLISGPIYLEGSGQRLASAVVASALKGGFKVEAGGRTFTLARASAWGRSFALTENGVQVGSIVRRGFFSSKSTADFPDNLAPEIQAFLIWLLILIWQRQVMMAGLIGVTGAIGAGAGR